jgi:hypothetical protein
MVTTVSTLLSLTSSNTHTHTECQGQHTPAGDKHLAGVNNIASNIRHILGLGLDIDMLTTEASVPTLSTSTLTASNIQTSTQCQTQHVSAGDGHLGDGGDDHNA